MLQNMQLVANQEQRTAVDVLESLGGVAEGFVERYDNILSMLNGPALVMTIYNPSFERDPSMAHLQRSCELVVGMFNDIIQQLVRKHEKDLLELREIFTDERDYANPIEPSHVGGGKLADEILNWASSFKPSSIGWIIYLKHCAWGVFFWLISKSLFLDKVIGFEKLAP